MLEGHPTAFFPFIEAGLQKLERGNSSAATEILRAGMEATALYRLADFASPLHTPLLNVELSELRQRLVAEGADRIPLPTLRTAEALLLNQSSDAPSSDGSAGPASEVIRLLDEALVADASFGPARLLRAALQVEADQMSEARILLGRLDAAWRPWSEVLEVRLCLRWGNLDEADQIAAGIGDGPDEPEPQLLRLVAAARAHFEAGQPVRAAELVEAALKLEPRYLPLRRLAFELNSLSVEVLRRVKEEGASPSEHASSYQRLLADVRRDLGID